MWTWSNIFPTNSKQPACLWLYLNHLWTEWVIFKRSKSFSNAFLWEKLLFCLCVVAVFAMLVDTTVSIPDCLRRFLGRWSPTTGSACGLWISPLMRGFTVVEQSVPASQALHPDDPWCFIEQSLNHGAGRLNGNVQNIPLEERPSSVNTSEWCTESYARYWEGNASMGK